MLDLLRVVEYVEEEIHVDDVEGAFEGLQGSVGVVVHQLAANKFALRLSLSRKSLVPISMNAERFLGLRQFFLKTGLILLISLVPSWPCTSDRSGLYTPPLFSPYYPTSRASGTGSLSWLGWLAHP